MGKMKRFVVDGHNLIPKIPGLSLQDAEDENALIERLNEFCRLSRSHVDVFFDGAPSSEKMPGKSGVVKVHFIKKGFSADDAIIEFTRRNQRPESPLVIISSDHRIQNAIKGTGAASLTSEAFSMEMQRVFSSPAAAQAQKEKRLTENEVKQWLDEFERNQSGQENS
jgi:predicted RNA-binding protein with PIN domain